MSDDEKLIADAAQHFAREVLAPRVRDMDAAATLLPDIITGLFDAGLLGIEIDEQFGGAGGSFVGSCLAIEELSKVDPSVAVLVDIQNTLVNRCVSLYGTDAQRATWLPRLAESTVGSFCLSEPSSGSDAFALRTKAIKQDDSTWVLNGEKAWISNAREAGLFLVFATVDKDAGYKGVTCFLVPADSPGLAVGPPEKKLGIKASSTCPVVLNDVKAHDVLGQVGKGYAMAISALNEGRIGIGAQMVGLAAGALESTIPYLKERTQFGQPVFDFQGVHFPLAQLAADLRAARALVYDVARFKEEISLSSSSTDQRALVRDAAMAKLVSCQVAERVASKCVELLGGVGFTEAFLAEKFYRDAKIGAIYEGTTNIQLMTIAKHL